ncbi:LysM domain/BON superfamily protein [Clostridium acetireducens DSM 10703]|jgi:LysM repeat protein|uniref:LysM domain/BON superfamily protein n=1 Tax=Clostridium acetireducens DSM 10703 TaxID=1121290 RepID=A0A1E8EYU9_9CLOT|nr:SPOCS domain-containing protein [Clostridium acetireducens]OFI06176.1 LysM domain/BON superfamily protein [Clostridium acetireducens DSM 10703]
MAIELIKENIECEQLLGESTVDTVIKSEHIVPDTHPDVKEILTIDAKPYITNKEIIQDKLYIEGEVEYNILYLSLEEDGKHGIYNIIYNEKFSNSIEMDGINNHMLCDSKAYVEHIECKISNERKVSVEGVIKLKGEVYKNYDFKVIKDITGGDSIQMLKNPVSVDKIVGKVSDDLIATCEIRIDTDKPEVGSILKKNIKIHKRDIKILEDNVQIDIYALIGILYRGKDTKDIFYIEEDVLVSKEFELEGVNPSMDNYTDFKVRAMELNVKEDDLGEDRIIEVETLIKFNTRISNKENIDMIEDVYSPNTIMDMERKDYDLNVIHGHGKNETIVKENIEITSDMPKASEIIICYGDVCVTNKRIVEDKVIVDGILNVNVIYKTEDEEKYIYNVNNEIAFNCSVDIPGCKIDMQSVAKASLESLEANIEANTIAVKAIIEVESRVNYIKHKEFLVNIEPVEGEIPEKKASVIIYVVQNGDTLWKISKRYYTTIDELININDIEDPNRIKPGQKIIIPGRAIM